MAKRLRLGVLVSGRGTNLQSIINSIEADRLNAKIEIIISDNLDAKALERAKKHGIKGVSIIPGDFNSKQEYEEKMITILEEHGVELVAMAGFITILSSHFIEYYRNRLMNIHPSLLPAFPGLDAQRQAFKHGVKVTGCTVHFAYEGMDTGPIILQEAVQVLEDDTVASLSRRILAEEHQIYPKAIQLFADRRLKVEGRKVEIL
ncbi:phosphoribosylglycinamide formyltransferase [Selenihalanaerobacter shriftii]|uniref:Phosphoribosylglycinamide formyltransferase n=1 Tax=Selenihalanaerobacter shriftii TaxID=142842 RepID=A0A1T4NQA1_9FIRM|nr:phosphoribosylglycinamide formyltransferase [Selenihalanaerobacter shriftii]SJZ81369.1 formyltetrahydrofolate-dependent phosphoribosylglycinamide formyltransferase [Selenihalanaerobacter shriftii]